MAEYAIRVQGLGKRYTIGGGQASYGTLGETITEAVTAPFRRAARLLRGRTERTAASADAAEAFWALRDVSFDIKRGEVVGIIGCNGAGKSTLLKILSQITEPTEGRVEMYGRVGSLLEVGTGFHAELTGRENVYLNGAILGMKRRDIDRQFDEIVAFAEVKKFIDTPVKHYSSGMYLRLAFAVAAHLEPEILIVDEVLAVGDAEFQRKCLGKMSGVAQQGRTVLFVSHTMPAITRLCSRAILLHEGRVVQDGPAPRVVRTYLSAGGGTAIREWDRDKAPGGDVARLLSVQVRTKEAGRADEIDIRQEVGLEMDYEVLQPQYTLLPSFHVYNEDGVHLFSAVEQDPAWRQRPRPTGRYLSTAWIPGNFLSEGTMFVDVGLTTLGPAILQFFERQAVSFHIVDSPDGDAARGDWVGKFSGVVRPLLKWHTVWSGAGVAAQAVGCETQRSF
jgi:lipopolysaccharide transport system ATP-binding protein